MPYNPGVTPMGGQLLSAGINQGVNTLNQDLMEALKKYEDDKKQRNFNTGLLDTLTTDPQTKAYIDPESLQKWDSLNSDKQAGILAGVMRRHTDAVQKSEMALRSSQTGENLANTNLINAKANTEWTGQGDDAALNLTPEEIAAGSGTGRVPLRTSRKSFQWVEDPNNPANMGTAEPMPIDQFGRRVEPTDTKTPVIGLQQPDGKIKLFPKESDMQQLIRAGIIKTPGAPAPASTATPAATGTPAPPKVGDVVRGYRFKGGDPKDRNNWEQAQ